ncbi:MAG: multiheme c-type cytochrome [Sterolibacterium sp.]|nr:multiheme c-type cytochrome [Sterolibacterium sp.]
MTSAWMGTVKFTRHLNFAVAFFIFFFACSISSQAAGVLSQDDKNCLECHSQEKFEKPMAEGEMLSLHIPGKDFAASVHNAVGCTGCHADIDLKKHPQTSKKKITLRSHSMAMVQVCKDCHDDKFKLYEGSIHATLLRDGNEAAPLCSDCHSPHSIRKDTASAPMAEVSCRQCHTPIYKAYAESVHGQIRGKPEGGHAPLCPDCHKAHEVTAASTGNQLKDACLGCHTNALAVHKTWLPNTDRHFEAVSCPACHAPTAKRRVNLRLYDSIAQERVAEKQGVPQFESRARSADSKGLGLDALALQSLLKEFNREGSEGKTILRGRLEVSTGAEAHQLAPKARAIKECDSCHREGAAPFQTVTISIVSPDGRPLHYGAQKEVLNSATSVDSVGGFYAIGGTRIKLLDVLFVLTLLAGIGIPLGHMTLKWLFRRYLRQIEAERQATQPQADSQASSGDNSTSPTKS